MKKRTISQKHVVYLEAGNTRLINLPFYKGGAGPRLQRVVAYNDKYMLTVYIAGIYHYLFIFNTDKEMQENGFLIYHVDGDRKGKSEKPDEIIQLVNKYFPDCKLLMNKITANIKANPKEGGKQGFYNTKEVPVIKDILDPINNLKCK